MASASLPAVAHAQISLSLSHFITTVVGEGGSCVEPVCGMAEGSFKHACCNYKAVCFLFHTEAPAIQIKMT